MASARGIDQCARIDVGEIRVEAKSGPRARKEDKTLNPFSFEAKQVSVSSVLGTRAQLTDERRDRPRVPEGLIEDEISELLVEDSAGDHAHRWEEMLDQRVIIPRVTATRASVRELSEYFTWALGKRSVYV